MRGDGSGDAIIVLGITLCFLQGLLAACGPAAEIRELWGFAIMRLHDLFAHDGHEMRGAITKILPHFFIANTRVGVRCGAHVRRGHGVSTSARSGQVTGVDLPRSAAIAEAEETSVPFLCIGQPDFDVDVRALGRIQHQLHNGPSPSRIALHSFNAPRINLQSPECQKLAFIL